MSTPPFEPPWFTPGRLDADAIVRRAAIATSTGVRDAVGDAELTRYGVRLTLAEAGARDRAARALEAAGYTVVPATHGPPGLTVTGWDNHKLAQRATALAGEVARREAQRHAEARAVLAVYRDQLDRGADPELARLAVDQHLRHSADEQMEDFAEAQRYTRHTGGSVEHAEVGNYGELPRRTYLPVLSQREAQALGQDGLADEADPTSEQVAGIAALEDAAEQLATRRYQVAEEVIARYQALSTGAPRPDEQALDELRDSIWAEADNAIHARGDFGDPLWEARRTQRSYTPREQHPAEQQASEAADTAAPHDNTAAGADRHQETSSDAEGHSSGWAEELDGEAEDDSRRQAECEHAVHQASISVERLLEQRAEQERAVGEEIEEWFTESATDSSAAEHTGDSDYGTDHDADQGDQP